MLSRSLTSSAAQPRIYARNRPWFASFRRDFFKTAIHMNLLASQDPEIAAAMDAEYQRQQDGLEMIASENYTSLAVMQAVGSVLTNKYAEGYPGRRYYGGCEHVDTIERIAIDRVCRLFGADRKSVV